MDVLLTVIIWCDVSFENDQSYRAMTDQFKETTSGVSAKPEDPINMTIFAEGQEELRANNVLLITARTVDDAKRHLNEHKTEKIFVICSGTLGRHFVPHIVKEYPLVHQIYIYTSNFLYHVDWADNYPQMVKMFNFHTKLLLRLTRDISKHLIERGKMLLSREASGDALTCFKHAQDLEAAANRREKIPNNPNDQGTPFPQPDFRAHLDLLEGENGLIANAQAAMRKQGLPLQSS